MGCDIHLYVEQFVKGKWRSIDRWYYDKDSKRWAIYWTDRFYRGRNYILFSILANVRNKDNDIDVLAFPKGVPPDVSPRVKSEIKWNEADGHSHSYFTLKELEQFDWEKEVNGHTYSQWVGSYFNNMITQLKERDEPQNIRLVFFFDN